MIRFLKTAFVMVIFSAMTLPAQVKEFRAVKITNVDSEVMFFDGAIASAMDYLASININVVLVVVWNGSQTDGTHTLYPSAVMDSLFGRPIHPHPKIVGRDPLKRIIIEAHRNGIEVFPWFELGFATGYNQNGGYILKQKPEWTLRDRQGNLVNENGFDWMSAIHPGPQQMILDLALEVVDKYDVDGVEWSDRIPALPVEGGYEDTTVAMYKAEHNGQSPPQDYNNSAWKEWRADKMTDYLGRVRDSIKGRGEHLIFSSSPSVYPWGYDNYLQDSEEWVDRGIIDNLIPQLYRYSLEDYIAELDKSLSYVPLSWHNRFYAGLLVRSGSYVIDPEFMLESIAANRARNVYGDVFFFYEGLRANDDLLGDTLKATYYGEKALNPEREGVWRPLPEIVNEDDDNVAAEGDWTETSSNGYDDTILYAAGSSDASITYSFDVPYDGWFDLFAYVVTGGLAAENAPYTVLHPDGDSTSIIINQVDGRNGGWQPLETLYLEQGLHTLLRLSTDGVAADRKVTADAAMLMLNRKLSPDVLVTGIDKEPVLARVENFTLYENYPNPFNGQTTIRFELQRAAHVRLEVFDLLGRKVQTLLNEQRPAGAHTARFNSATLSSGFYFYRLTDGKNTQARKMLLIK